MIDWIEYWDKENNISDNIWAKNNAYFFKNTLLYIIVKLYIKISKNIISQRFLKSLCL